MVVNVYLLMGDRNTRKSSTVRSLTGIGKSRVCNIELSNGKIIDIFTMIQALQEADVDPKSFFNLVNKENYSNVLVPLRIDKAKNCPNGSKYIELFLAKGWQVHTIFVLGRKDLPYRVDSKVVTKPIENPIRPNSQNAKVIKKIWGWA